MEVRRNVTGKVKNSVHFHFDLYISRIYLIKGYPHGQVKKCTLTFVLLKMIAPLVSRKGSSNPCPILENSNLVPEGVLGQEHLFHYTDSHLFFATIKCKPYSSTTVKVLWLLKGTLAI